MKSIPTALRRLIVNFPTTQGWIGEIELLRGDMLDVVELRTGDQFRGTLKETEYPLTTFYGPVNVPIDNVIGIINVGQFRPRQLLVTSDGQIFGGRLKKETIDLRLSSGQVTQIPLSQVSRVGYRKRAQVATRRALSLSEGGGISSRPSAQPTATGVEPIQDRSESVAM